MTWFKLNWLLHFTYPQHSWLEQITIAKEQNIESSEFEKTVSKYKPNKLTTVQDIDVMSKLWLLKLQNKFSFCGNTTETNNSYWWVMFIDESESSLLFLWWFVSLTSWIEKRKNYQHHSADWGEFGKGKDRREMNKVMKCGDWSIIDWWDRISLVNNDLILM